MIGRYLIDHHVHHALRLSMAVAALMCLGQPANAADFFLFLKCEGKVAAKGKTTPGQVQFALRDNNTTALIQQSNILPVGERLKYDASPVAYSMSYQVPRTETTVLYDWWRGQIFIWQPSLKQVSKIRLSIDRQSGNLTGEMLNAKESQLATLAMVCEPINESDLPAPKF